MLYTISEFVSLSAARNVRNDGSVFILCQANTQKHSILYPATN